MAAEARSGSIRAEMFPRKCPMRFSDEARASYIRLCTKDSSAFDNLDTMNFQMPRYLLYIQEPFRQNPARSKSVNHNFLCGTHHFHKCTHIHLYILHIAIQCKLATSNRRHDCTDQTTMIDATDMWMNRSIVQLWLSWFKSPSFVRFPPFLHIRDLYSCPAIPFHSHISCSTYSDWTTQ